MTATLRADVRRVKKLFRWEGGRAVEYIGE